MASDTAFEKCMSILQNFYGGVVILDDGFVESIYFKALERLSDEQLENAIATCIKKNSRAYGYFPSADQLLEYAGHDPHRFPGECVKSTNLLPSTEMKTEAMTAEHRAVMLDALRLVAEKRTRRKFRPDRKWASVDDVFSPETARKSLLEDMRKYLNSGLDELRQRAINWASNPENGCELVRVDGRVVDIRELDF
jgi:hypothetical protein